MGNVCIGSLVGEIFYHGCSNLLDDHQTKRFCSYKPPQTQVIISNNNKNKTCNYILDHQTPNIHQLYRFGRELGRGNSGVTLLCTEIATGIDYACKSIPKTRNPKLFQLQAEDVRGEIEVMQHLRGQEHVVTIKDVYEDDLCVHIVMELCLGGELFDFISKKVYFSEREAAELMKIVVGVVETCHSLGVMHRDLKLDNFALGYKDDVFSLKAIDFGLSVFFKSGQVFGDKVGTLYYVAPEILLDKQYGPEADIWSAGVILYALLSGRRLPFKAETGGEMLELILRGELDFESEPWPQRSDCAKDLVRKMLCSEPSDRLTAKEVLGHPWICHNVS